MQTYTVFTRLTTMGEYSYNIYSYSYDDRGSYTQCSQAMAIDADIYNMYSYDERCSTYIQ
jgi:hypothetical protein